MSTATEIPADFPVRPIAADDPGAKDPVTCGACGRTWDDAIPTSYTPAPSARCPFEAWHEDDDDDDDDEQRFELEHDGDYHRLQVDGGDLVSLQDNGDGTGYLIVYAGNGENDETVFEAPVYLNRA